MKEKIWWLLFVIDAVIVLISLELGINGNLAQLMCPVFIISFLGFLILYYIGQRQNIKKYHDQYYF